jgi:hypothetical protein
MEGIAQVDKAGVLIPVKYLNQRCMWWSSMENGDDRFIWSDTGGMSMGDENFRL